MSASRDVAAPAAAESHYWQRRRRGAAAPVLVGVLGLAALGLGQQLPIRHSMESDLTQRSRAALQAAGLGAVKVDFTGRDGMLTGSVGSTQNIARALAAVRGLDGVRVATARLNVPGAVSTGAGTAGGSASPSSSSSGSTALIWAQLTAVTAGGKVTLTGRVPSQDAHTALIDTATAAFGVGNVIDHLAVDPGVRPDGVAGFGGIVTALGTGSAATADLTGGLVTLTGVVADAQAATAAGDAATTVTGDATKVNNKLTHGAAGAGGVGSLAAEAIQVQSRLNALPQIAFPSGSDTLSPQGRGAVLQAAAILKGAAELKVQLRGYTDDLGDWDVNLGLSTARANTVRLTLIDNGVAAGTLTSTGLSENYPKVANDSPAHRAMNRRVIFAVLT